MNSRCIAVVAAVALLPLACSESVAPRPQLQMTATVNGAPFNANVNLGTPVAFLIDATGDLEVRAFQVAGDGSTREIRITIAGFTGPGEYPLAAFGSGGYGYYEYVGVGSGGTPLRYRTTEGATGSLTISAIDRDRETISGTFSFDAADLQDVRTIIGDGAFSGWLYSSGS